MKLFISISLIINSLHLYAQEFAPIGAKWHYNWDGFATTGYIEIKVTGDTIIDGKITKILTKKRFSHNFLSGSFDTLELGNEFIYTDSGKVYNYRYDSFYVLYDFFSLPNNEWIIAGNDLSCDSLGRTKVDSVDTTIINSITLRKLKLIPVDSSHWEFKDIVLERIGCLEYMFPEPNINCGIADIGEGGALRCYEDSSFGKHETGIAFSCDSIVSVYETPKSIQLISVNPKVFDSFLIITISPKLPTHRIEANIFNLRGELIFQDYFSDSNYRIRLNGLSSGVYILEIKSNTLNYREKIIKI